MVGDGSQLIGAVGLFAGNFAPRSYAFCHGQLQSISSNSALFSILGTTYGGDGRSTFGLPDLRGRAAIGAGNGPGLPSITLGQKFGNAYTTLLTSNLPAHRHGFYLYDGQGDTNNGTGSSFAKKPVDTTTGGSSKLETFKTALPTIPASEQSVGLTGSGQQFSNMPPSLGLNYCIALTGIYPSRS